MKNLVVLFAIVFTCLVTSCTQRTCPTYTKGIKEVPHNQQVELQEEEPA